MKQGLRFVARTILGGFLVVIPIYLVVLLLLRVMKSVVGLVQPVAQLFPESVPAENLLSLLLVLMLCFLVGLVVRARGGEGIRERIESSVVERIPGYKLIRSLTQQIAGTS